MPALRFGLPIALSAALAFGAYASYPGNDALALALASTGQLVGKGDAQLNSDLTAMIASAEIGPNDEVFFNRALTDQRFLEPNSGRYWQISGEGQGDFSSRSLRGRQLKASGHKAGTEAFYYDSDQFADEPLRVAERMVRLPGSDVEWRFVVARRAID